MGNCQHIDFESNRELEAEFDYSIFGTSSEACLLESSCRRSQQAKMKSIPTIGIAPGELISINSEGSSFDASTRMKHSSRGLEVKDDASLDRLSKQIDSFYLSSSHQGKSLRVLEAPSLPVPRSDLPRDSSSPRNSTGTLDSSRTDLELDSAAYQVPVIACSDLSIAHPATLSPPSLLPHSSQSKHVSHCALQSLCGGNVLVYLKRADWCSLSAVSRQTAQALDRAIKSTHAFASMTISTARLNTLTSTRVMDHDSGRRTSSLMLALEHATVITTTPSELQAISIWNLFRTTKSLKALTILRASVGAVSALGHCVPPILRLQVLSLGAPAFNMRITDSQLTDILEATGRTMLSLSLFRVFSLTCEGLVSIGEHCTGLQHLTVLSCSDMRLSSLSLKAGILVEDMLERLKGSLTTLDIRYSIEMNNYILDKLIRLHASMPLTVFLSSRTETHVKYSHRASSGAKFLRSMHSLNKATWDRFVSAYPRARRLYLDNTILEESEKEISILFSNTPELRVEWLFVGDQVTY